MQAFNPSKSLRAAFFIVLSSVLLTAAPAHAYLDPASGGYVLQVIVAAFVGIGFTMKTYWNQIKTTVASWFGGSKASS